MSTKPTRREAFARFAGLGAVLGAFAKAHATAAPARPEPTERSPQWHAARVRGHLANAMTLMAEFVQSTDDDDPRPEAEAEAARIIEVEQWASLCLLGDYLERCCGAPEALALPNTTDAANLTPLFRSMNALQDAREACRLWQAGDPTSFVPDGIEAVLHSCWISLNCVTRPWRSHCSRCDQAGGVRRDRLDTDDEFPRFHCKRCSVSRSTTQSAKE